MSESTVDDHRGLLVSDPDRPSADSADEEAPVTGPATRGRHTRRVLPWYEALCLALAIGLATGLVFYDLGRRSLWIDEGTTWGTASQHGASLWYWLLHDGGNMLGYYAAMHVLMPIIGSSPFALRFPGALCVVATVPCGYFLLKKLFDWQAGAAGALLLAASGPVVFFGQQARGYAPAILFTTASAWALAVAVIDRRRGAWIAFVITATIAAYMTLLATLAVLALLVALFLVRRDELEIRRVLISVGTLFALWTPLAIAAIRRGSGQLDWIQQLTLTGPNSYQSNGMEIVSSQGNAVVATLTGAACLLGLGVLVFRLTHRGGRSTTGAFPPGLLVAWVAIPLVTLMVITAVMTPVFSDRYIIPEVPAASLLAAAAITRIRWRWVPIGLVAVVALVVSRTMQTTSTYGWTIEDWVGTVNYVVANYQPHDCVGFFVADGFTTFDYYYLALPRPHVSLPDPVVPSTTWASKSPFVLDPETIAPPQLAHLETSCKRLWMVVTHASVEAPGPGVPRYFSYKYFVHKRFVKQLRDAHFVLSNTVGLVAVEVDLYTHA
jgi:mannosyltransferase